MKTINDFNDFLDEVIKHVEERKNIMDDPWDDYDFYIGVFRRAYNSIFRNEKNNWRINIIKKHITGEDSYLNYEASLKLRDNIYYNIVDHILHIHFEKNLKKWFSMKGQIGILHIGPFPYVRDYDKEKITAHTLLEISPLHDIPYNIFSEYDIKLNEKYFNLLNTPLITSYP